MDYEEIEYIDSNYTSSGPSAQHIIQETILALVCLIAISANSLIIFIIFRFKKMHTAPNILLANWAIADLLSLFFVPSRYEILSTICRFKLPYEFKCFLHKCEIATHCTTLLFVLILAVDWYLAAYFQNASQKLRNSLKFVIGSSWILALVIIGSTIAYCISERVLHSMQLEMISITYAVLLLFVIFVHCFNAVRKCMKRPSDYSSLMLTLTTVFVGCWSLAFLDMLILIIAEKYYDVMAVVIIEICSIYGNSVVNFVLLYYLNQDFQSCVTQALQRGSNRYEEVRFDSQNTVGEHVADEPFQISFNHNREL